MKRGFCFAVLLAVVSLGLGVGPAAAQEALYFATFSDTLATSSIQRLQLPAGQVQTLFTRPGLVQGVAADLGAAEVYWTLQNLQNDSAELHRTRFDGGGDRVLTSSAGGSFLDVELDLGARRVYWLDADLQAIKSLNMDGTAPATVALQVDASYFALDALGRQLYWVDRTRAALLRAPIAGGSPAVLAQFADPTGLGTAGIAVDVRAGRVFWSSGLAPSGQVFSALLNGSGQLLVRSNLSDPADVALSSQSVAVVEGAGLSVSTRSGAGPISFGVGLVTSSITMGARALAPVPLLGGMLGRLGCGFGLVALASLFWRGRSQAGRGLLVSLRLPS
jgi:hypothetical protein